jgi:hypothetical protein
MEDKNLIDPPITPVQPIVDDWDEFGDHIIF